MFGAEEVTHQVDLDDFAPLLSREFSDVPSDDDAGVYCLGVLGDGIFLAGSKSLRRYDLDKDGRFMWEARFESPSYGHGVLTGDAIYMPTGDEIAKVDAATGKVLAQVGVFSPTKEPVGNLFSDGQRLLAVGMARAYALQDQGFDTVEANHRLGFEDDERDFRLGAEILKAMGFNSVRLMTNNPAKVAMMEASGVEVTERVPLKVGENPHNLDYLATKAKKSGHLL